MGFRNLKFDEDSVFLVTGGAGFIGSNICEAVLELGYTVRCLDNLSTGKYREHRTSHQEPEIHLYQGRHPGSGHLYGSHKGCYLCAEPGCMGQCSQKY